MRRLSFLLLVAAVTGSPSQPSLHGRIVFEATRTTRAAGLVVMDATGSHRRRLRGTSTLGTLAIGRGAYAYSRLAADGELHAMVTDAAGTRDLGPGQPSGFSPDGRTVVVQNGAAWELRDRTTAAVRGTFPSTMTFDGWSPAGLLFEVSGDLVVEQPDGSGARSVAHASLGPPSASPDGGWIAYSTAGVQAQLHLVRPDGSDDHAIGDVTAPFPAVWSPDGSHLAFLSPIGELVVASPIGATINTHTPVVHSGRIGAWSPDGRRFAFVAVGPRGREPQLTVFSPGTSWIQIGPTAADDVSWSPDGRMLLVAGSGTLAVVPPAANAKPTVLATNVQSPAWLQDSRLLVFLNGEEREQLASVAPTGGHVRYIAGTADDLEPAVAPDGTKIAFASRSGKTDRWTIVTARADGSGRRVLARSDAIAPSPTWPPNGRSIAYATYTGILVVSAMGGRPRSIASADSSWTVAWAPATQIAFGDGDTDFADIVVVDRDGTHRRVVARGVSGYNWGGLAWSPDGKTIAVARRSDAGGDPDGNPDLYLVDIRTHREREIGLELHDPSFSPDGARLAVSNDNGTVDVIDLRTGGERAVATGSNPTWSR
jgi:Tol biopolymer transport system component